MEKLRNAGRITPLNKEEEAARALHKATRAAMAVTALNSEKRRVFFFVAQEISHSSSNLPNKHNISKIRDFYARSTRRRYLLNHHKDFRFPI